MESSEKTKSEKKAEEEEDGGGGGGGGGEGEGGETPRGAGEPESQADGGESQKRLLERAWTLLDETRRQLDNVNRREDQSRATTITLELQLLEESCHVQTSQVRIQDLEAALDLAMGEINALRAEVARLEASRSLDRAELDELLVEHRKVTVALQHTSEQYTFWHGSAVNWLSGGAVTS